ncbi:MAG: DUF4300 family protein [Lachnospiraceae bacterium]|nr:DUF4300 family protein [Lachnospiraceae bacterium]
MNKRLMLLGAVFAMSAMLLAGCGSKTTPASQKSTETEMTQDIKEDSMEASDPIPLTYSFLYDDGTKEEVRNIMEADGIKPERVDKFMEIVTQFSDTLGEMEGAAEGFVSIDASKAFYDSEYIGMTFDKKLGFDDQNCRLTAYSLFQDFYTVSDDSTYTYDDDSLYGDLEIIKTNKNLNFTKEDISKYTTLFADVKTEASTDIAQHAETIKETWKERGITFDNESKVQLLSIMLHDPVNNTVFAGHAGVLFETEDGFLVIEKRSQYTPFVAGKFNDLESLNTYLLSEVSIMQQDGAADSFVMRNDELLVK